MENEHKDEIKGSNENKGPDSSVIHSDKDEYFTNSPINHSYDNDYSSDEYFTNSPINHSHNNNYSFDEYFANSPNES